jgi:hypothetical protein
LRKSCEGRFEIAVSSGIFNNESQAERARRRPQVCDLALDIREGRVCENAEHGNGIIFRRTEQLVALAAAHSLPAIFVVREAVLAGGLMS